ncbi:MAG: hypothetical protein JW934_05750 [Anaerolineae bacterium]|nr:hypothetical protein [Anaerolineae bacterium]
MGPQAGKPLLSSRVEVAVPLERARAWFLSLRDHPERYRFATHEGFAFTQGDFGRAGARFQTVERFLGVCKTLHFELIAVGETSFEFTLLDPLNGQVWGAFILEARSPALSALILNVGAHAPLGARFLRFWLVRLAVQRQIDGEVRHIKTSMEALSAQHPCRV